MKLNLCSAIAVLVVMFSGSVFADEVRVVPTVPGIYTVNDDSTQQVPGIYHINTVPVKDRSIVVELFNVMLADDGKAGGRAVASVQTIDGRQIILLAVKATKEAQVRISKMVEQINQGSVERFIEGSYPLHYFPKNRDAATMGKIIKNEITKIGYVYVDEVINKVTVVDSPRILPYLGSILEANDVAPRQLTIQVQVIETKKGTNSNLGTYWDAWKQSLPSSTQLKLVGEPKSNGSGLEVTNLEALIAGTSPQALSMFLNYLQQQDIARVEAKTMLNVANAQPATFKAGHEIPYQLLTEQGDVDKLENQISFVGLQLTVQAIIGTEQTRMVVHADSTSMLGISAAGAPILATSVVDTTLDVKGKDTFVLSGLKCSTEISTRSGVPILGSIPLFKYLFSSEKKIQEDWDVTILVSVL